MEQSNLWGVLAASMAKTNWVPNVQGDKASDVANQFQKLLDQKNQTAQSGKTGSQSTQTANKADNSTVPVEKGEASVQKEDPLERVKKLAEQGYVITQPEVGTIFIDIETGETLGIYDPGEYVLATKEGDLQLIPVSGLESWEKAQLQQLLDDAGPVQTIDVSDPEGDAMLEATDPNAEHSPVDLLDEAMNKEVSQAVRQVVVEEFQPEQEDDTQVEVKDVEQAPQPLFNDVKAAPIKVGETYHAEQAEAPDVATQIDSQLAQAMAQGQSRVEIQLTPENLGTVKVEITQAENGGLHITITAENSQTRSLLERHAGNLQAMLADQRQTNVQVEVQRQEESQRQQENPYDGHNGQNQQQGQQRQQRQEHNSQDFIQQLRLGLIPLEDESLS